MFLTDCSPKSKLHGDVRTDVVIDLLGQNDSARRGNAFEASGDVDRVAVDVTAFDDDIAEVQPDAKIQPVVVLQGAVAFGEHC